MNLRATAWLAVIAIGLGAFIYFYEIEGESARQAALDEEKRIHPGLDATAIDLIELRTQDGEEARFERIEDRWRVTAPVVGRANASSLDAMANALAALPREGIVASPGPLDEYGLASETRTVHFVVDGVRRGLRIGRSTPVGGHVYVARLSDDDVAFVERYRINAFNATLDDLRDRRVLDFDRGQVRTLRISWPDGAGRTEVAVARDADGQWQMGTPVAGRADQQTMRDLISTLANLQAADFIDEVLDGDASDGDASDEVERALAEPALRIHWTRPGDHAERRLRISAPTSLGPIAEAPDGQRFVLDPERMTDFRRDVVSYRFKMISEFDLVDARAFTIEYRDAPSSSSSDAAVADPGHPVGASDLRVEATLEEAGWSAAETPLDATRASNFVRRLASLRADDIFAEEMGSAELASLGLAPPRVRIRIERGAAAQSVDAALADVELGRLDPDRGLFAKRHGEGTVYLLSASGAVGIPLSRDAFANEFIAQPDAPDAEAVEADSEVIEIDPLEGVETP